MLVAIPCLALWRVWVKHPEGCDAHYTGEDCCTASRRVEPLRRADGLGALASGHDGDAVRTLGFVELLLSSVWNVVFGV